MSSRSPYEEVDEQAEGRRVPRWLWVSGVVVVTVVLLLVVVTLLGGGHPRPNHGPGGDEAPTGQLPSGHIPPEGAH